MLPSRAALNMYSDSKDHRPAPHHEDCLSCHWCNELSCYGTGEDHNWGFHIYRTTFVPGSDERFATALAILDANLRVACFREQGPNGDRREKSGPSERLWQRLKSEVIEDRALDGAPPAAVKEHFRAWIKEQGYHLPDAISPDPSLEMASSSTHRFCLLIDEEPLDNLLRFPLPTPFYATNREDHIGVKVLDVEIDAEDYDPPYAEGWLWAAPWELVNVWFHCRELSFEEFSVEDDRGRPVMFIDR
nr:hypothetical protein B0A51_03985 [Rachicladosporium sp. CCFEE 5018]